MVEKSITYHDIQTEYINKPWILIPAWQMIIWVYVVVFTTEFLNKMNLDTIFKLTIYCSWS